MKNWFGEKDKNKEMLNEECDAYPDRLLLNYADLNSFAKENGERYVAADPYPHIIIDNFLGMEVVDQILNKFPQPDADVKWRQISAKNAIGDKAQYKKQGLPREFEMPAIVRQLIWELNSGTFIRILERLTGIKNLLPDPLLRGGGIHQVLPGGVLGVHADFTRHTDYDLDRRVNVLVYLNKDWHDNYEGHLELWDRGVSRCVKRIRPTAARCVIFNTDADSFHGHPRELKCPEGITRKSIALYYYSVGRPEAASEVLPTSATDWQVLPSVELPELQ
ncbi:MAG: 2OG-Fe(II) oxygenase [Pseudomonadales bacterium]